jgi:hemicentin
MQQVLRAHIKNTLHKLNVHAALTPTQIKEFFEPVFLQAIRLRKAYEKADQKKRSKVKMPFVTVFLDEVNTSSCLGLFKEILVDRTLDGDPIPDNLFMVAACNPHRGNSMATHAAETWVRSSYYVRPLHPTLEFLIWDYGSLDEYKERDYIRVKLQMLHQELPNIEVVTLTDLIVESQSLMRRYAARQLRKQGMNPEDVEVSSHSCVSQRDIQRVFTFYQWLVSIYNRKKQHGERRDYNRRALMVSLGIVYYMRLNSEYREDYSRILDKKCTLPNEVNFTKAFFSEMDWFCDNIELPPGIAKTRALKENLFATIVCTVTHTPLIIVGAPGSSKTLSFNLTISNLKGPESKKEIFRDVDIFKSLDPHFYQCSRRTTSNEVQTVFSRAINRQYSHAKFSLPIYCVVFMDEAGLPEESHESLKVLHYHLDKQEVSFVAITNHVLDAAKTNRAVSLFRPEVSEEDLKVLAKGCLCQTPEKPPPELKQDLNIIVQFCPAYMKIMERDNMNELFGLRDFIHFVNYLRRRRGKEMLTPKLVQEGLERNFNGICWAEPGEKESFEWLCNVFLKKMQGYDGSQNRRSLLDVLHSSLKDRPERGGGENEVRYKLIIDPSEDNSLVQLLMTFKVLDRKKTHVYVCSDFPGDSQLQKINTIAAIRHSAIVGHTVVMSQTDDIHESFYDLFNQRFRMIDDPKLGPRYYANIAIGAHLKPCRVHQDFQCVIVIRKSEIKNTPAPFLNRFEKYYISHRTLLDTSLNHLPPCMKIIYFTEMIGRLNDIIEDDKTGGGMIGGHRLTLGMHLLRHLQSATDLLNDHHWKRLNAYFHQQC